MQRIKLVKEIYYENAEISKLMKKKFGRKKMKSMLLRELTRKYFENAASKSKR